MTTEIAVLNRLGVALATDSAVTITGAGKQKVFDTGDKLFELCVSSNDAVGVMINGNMDLLGVPWEVIIKSFRAIQHSDGVKPMKGWMQSLFDFIATHKTMNDNQEEQYVSLIMQQEISEVLAIVFTEFRESTDGSSFGRSISTAISKRRSSYDGKPCADSLIGLRATEVANKHGGWIRERAQQALVHFEPAPEDIDELVMLVIDALLSSQKSAASTGIIVAGYSQDDMFPSMSMADVDGMVCGKLKYTHGTEIKIDRKDSPAKVVSFAQTDVVDRILSGADDRFVSESKTYLSEALEESKTAVATAFEAAGLTPELASGVMDDVIAGVVGRYEREFVQDARNKFKSDFEDMVAMMPKQDVIELAEALVSITAVERNASSQQATVGGPVDIAFITKHEGFVWIKRKHYFAPDLNPRYFWRKKMELTRWETGE
jgi:hypothetical protein